MKDARVIPTIGRRRPPLATAVPPHFFFLVSALFHYLGPAFAVLLFARVDVLGVAWLRIAGITFVQRGGARDGAQEESEGRRAMTG